MNIMNKKQTVFLTLHAGKNVMNTGIFENHNGFEFKYIMHFKIWTLNMKYSMKESFELQTLLEQTLEKKWDQKEAAKKDRFNY